MRKVFDPNAEVVGRHILATLNNIQVDNMRPILEKHKLSEVKPDTWYPQQQWLDAIYEIETTSSAMLDLVAVGMKIAEYAPIPPDVNKDPMTYFQGASRRFQGDHRGNSGELEMRVIGERHVQMRLHTPYPPDLVYGITYGMARRGVPPDGDLVVRRSLEGDVVVCDVTW